jgi:hypothetical protein
VDRVMRLPGTINRPDAGKIKKGRTEALAELIAYNAANVYSLGQFAKAAAPQASAGATNAPAINLSGTVKRLASVDELPAAVSPKGRIVIVQGIDPDEPNKFSGRSEWLFYACCEMVRGGCSDDQIYAVITDPDFGISASVLDKGGMKEKYAARQIARARADTADPHLAEMNGRFFVIGDLGGKCVVSWQEYDDEMEWWTLRKQDRGDFYARFIQPVQVGTRDGNPICKPLGKWWFENPHRRYFDRVVFKPQGTSAPDEFNLWRGFAFDPMPGDCGLFLAFVRDVICGGMAERYEWLTNWMAMAVQRPERRAGTAVVLSGGQGVGKTFFAQHFGKLFGTHYKPVTKEEHVIGRFNAHLQDAVVVFADESFFAGNRKHANILKSLITGETQQVERKGVDTEFYRNCVHLIIASNDAQVVHVENDDRRYFILEVGPERKNDTTYFGAIAQQLRGGGYAALLDRLKKHDLSRFDPNAPPPETEAKHEHKQASFDGAEGVILDMLWTGELPNMVPESVRIDVKSGRVEINKACVVDWGRRQRPEERKKITPNTIAYVLRGPQANHVRRKAGLQCADGKLPFLPRYWELPALGELRRRWDETRVKVEWPNDDGVWRISPANYPDAGRLREPAASGGAGNDSPF